MNEPLIIKYETNSGGFDLGVLGDSLSGLNVLLKEYCELTGINGEIEVRTTRIEHGSIELHNLFHFTLTSTPFSTPQELYDFLRVANPEMMRAAQDFFSAIRDGHRSMNDYFTRNQFDQTVLGGLVTAFIIGAWKWTAKQKNRPTTQDVELGEITPRQAGKLHSIVQRGKYRRVVKPIVEGNARSLSAIASAAPRHIAVITEENMGDYLPEDARILPDLENGTTHDLTGHVVGLQSTHGETVKIKIYGIDPSNSLLMAHPDDGQDSEDFTDFYKKDVTVKAEIFRKSMYKRPELIIKEMSLLQQELL